MMRILCWIGLHRWSPWHQSVVSAANFEKAVHTFGIFRDCRCCDDQQSRDLLWIEGAPETYNQKFDWHPVGVVVSSDLVEPAPAAGEGGGA